MSQPDPALYRSSITKFYLYKVLVNLSLWAPVWVVYLLEKRGLTFTQLTLLDAPFWLVAALSEVPTGAVADTYGRKTSLAVGAGLYAVALVVFGLADSYLLILISYLLWGFSMSFFTGADTAFLYDSLRTMGREEDFTRVNGRAMALTQATWAAASLLGAPLGKIDLSLPIFLTAIIALLALGIILTFREPPKFQDHPTAGYWSTIGQGLRLTMRNPAVRYPTLYVVFLAAFSFMIMGIFFQPYVLGRGVPLEWLGLASVLLVRLPGMGGAEFAHRLLIRFGEKRSLILIPVGLTLATIFLAAMPGAGGLAFLPILAFLFWVPRPLLDTLVNRELPSALRATVISVQALMFSAVAFLVEPLSGYLADQQGLPFALTALALGGGTALVLILGLWNRWQRAVAPQVVPGDPPGEKFDMGSRSDL